MRRSIATALLSFCLSPIVAGAAAQPTGSLPPDEALAERVTALADTYVAEIMRRFPEQAAFSGLTLERHDGLTDNSQGALRSWQAQEDRWAAEIARIDAAALRGRPEWLVLGFLREAVESSRQLRVCRYELWPVNQMSGWQAVMAQLAGIQPVGSGQARTEALARWRKLPGYLSTEIDNLREGLRLGYSTPKRNVGLVIEQLDSLLGQPVDAWPLYSPATRDESEEFTQAWRELLTAEIRPAIERYRAFLADEYLAKARQVIAIKAHPEGEACYQASFRAYTTIDRPAAETFRRGQRAVERNLANALEIGRQNLQAQDLPALLERLKTDPANQFESRDELLAFAQAAVARTREHMPEWFSRVPKADIVVEPYPEFLERTASDSYWPAAEDGSRPAMYRITLYRHARATRSNAEITAFHEAYPGHHLQIGLAAERPSAHPITRMIGNSGFSEGWARYAEALAEEMGIYSSDHARANRRLWPARGMVIDPGIHLFGWTPEQAIEFAVESGRFDQEASRALVDRVVVWPGQLTAYDTGALEFFALREQAKQALGERFDIREFHAVLLENGTVTLPMLREQVGQWLEARPQGRSAEVP
jgi:uncharacterized protein (DUF885 family)